LAVLRFDHGSSRLRSLFGGLVLSLGVQTIENWAKSLAEGHAHTADSVLRGPGFVSPVAVVGASSNPIAPRTVSRENAACRLRHRAREPERADEARKRAQASLDDVALPVDIVVVFRRPEFTP
jgi:hypothetical protein